MHISHHLFLALASLPWTALSKDLPLARGHVSDLAENEHPDRLGLVERYSLPGPQCDSWVGIEMIFMVEVTEICPDGSTVTETMTKCVETLTRSICATATTNLPCYPCVMGTPPSSDTATVTMTSCSTATEETVTVTVQLCSTCTATTYVGTVPGYTPGGPCQGCTPYSSSLSSPCSEESGSAIPATTTTTTSTSTSTGSCTSTPPGNPGLPSSTTSTGAARNTPYKPTTAAPPVATAGGVRNGIADVMVLVVGCAVLFVFLGM
ncbi:hypothetical protein C8A01DRAFT_44042 [Parachaetomium inaequale]|uniref:Uncharacterized protein n=1 Tax=Parachaetomium inaequale TaxID=2588326 RepID=A0AAN6PLJ4_9PEZI|nr:hypothetical protein C8A01DRAFT_44042 [Parachaetomium inaequale]